MTGLAAVMKGLFTLITDQITGLTGVTQETAAVHTVMTFLFAMMTGLCRSNCSNKRPNDSNDRNVVSNDRLDHTIDR